jgi:transcriptional regulator with XRE-family HTH domain
VPRWTPLSSDLDPAIRRLVVSLRAVKDQSGLSTAALGRRTAYSRSSWDRYLNGRARPPEQAVAALAQLAGVDPTRLLAEREVAEAAWEQRPGDAVEQPAAEATDVPPGSGRRGGVGMWVAAAASIAVLAVALGVTLRLAGRDQPATTGSPHTCTFTTRDGRLYAGHSTKSDGLTRLNDTGDVVVEVQCLLRRHGFDPGPIDGIFGEKTEQAVKSLQRAGHVVVDGKVGPQTWALLRA